jgi:pimeloyl-ACP methyl ester carboxylesterase
MNVELCRLTTSDGQQLDGAFCKTAVERNSVPVDAFLLVHGTGGNFYSGSVFDTWTRLSLAAGIPVLRINTRGHDGLAGGERVADCVHDLAAWLDWLAMRGCRRVAVVGHSMGAVKTLLTAAHQPHDSIVACIALSPPRFCHAMLMADPRCAGFRDAWQRSVELVAAGRGDEWLSVTQPLPLVITAAGFVEKYGPEDRYDFVPWLDRLSHPTLFVFGEQTVATSPPFVGLPEIVEQRLPRMPAGSGLHVAPGGDMAYRMAPEEPFRRAAEWLELRASQ